MTTFLDEEDGYDPTRIAVDNEVDFLLDKPAYAKHPLNKNIKAEIAERNRVLALNSIPELEAWVNERVNRADYVALLDTLAFHLKAHKEYNERFKRVQSAYLNGFPDYAEMEKEKQRTISARTRFAIKHGTPIDESPILFIYNDYDAKTLQAEFDKQGYERVREEGAKVLKNYNQRELVKHVIHLYKNVTAIAVARLGELYDEHTPLPEYTEDILNKTLVRTGTFKSGSREWLEQRQQGIGGSDVGKIVGDSKDKTYNAKNKAGVIESKLDPITDEQVAEQTLAQDSFKTASARGNAWEEFVLHTFAKNNPDVNVVKCKTSWENSLNLKQKANFDGLIADDEGNITGIIEIKTSSRPDDWGPVELGLDGVPEHYKAQVLWYAEAGNLTHGVLVAIIHDREIREYYFDIDEKLIKEFKKNTDIVNEFYQMVVDVKAGKREDPRLIAPPLRPLFGPTYIKALSGNTEGAYNELSLWREEPENVVRDRFDELFNIKSQTYIPGRDAFVESLFELYANVPDGQRKRNIVSIDLETSNMSPNTGVIIDVGISVVNPKGEEVDKLDKLYGMPLAALNATSTGPIEVHGITEGMIAKKRQFSHPEEQKRVLEMLKNGIVYAHNASFEKRWLQQHLAGFADALKNGEIVFIDTMSLTRRLLPTDRYRLKSLVEYFGFDYVNAHRAYADALMTVKAVVALMNNFEKVQKDQMKLENFSF